MLRARYVPFQSIVIGMSVEAVGGWALLLFRVEKLRGLDLRREGKRVLKGVEEQWV